MTIEKKGKEHYFADLKRAIREEDPFRGERKGKGKASRSRRGTPSHSDEKKECFTGRKAT